MELNFWAGSKHFGTCKRTRHKYLLFYVFESVADVCFQQSDCKAKEVIFLIVDKKKYVGP